MLCSVVHRQGDADGWADGWGLPGVHRILKATTAAPLSDRVRADPDKRITDASARTQKTDPEANMKPSAQIWGLGRQRRVFCSSSHMPDSSLTSDVAPQPFCVQLCIHHLSARRHPQHVG